MTSEAGARECYVYITLPGATEFVTAGRFVLDAGRTGTPVGRFVYGRSYLERPDAVPIDPVELKLGKATYRTTALKACSARCAMPVPITGAGASSRNTRASRNSASSTIFSTRLKTGQARWDSG